MNTVASSFYGDSHRTCPVCGVEHPTANVFGLGFYVCPVCGHGWDVTHFVAEDGRHTASVVDYGNVLPASLAYADYNARGPS